ncbi:hypothetical protein NOL65_26320, partial [Vibrio parahaemolyticus]|uniref:hypothetical protein n=2 Tax=Vibrio parahaemolyticus TaxID=670 RepID=UPI00226B95F7
SLIVLIKLFLMCCTRATVDCENVVTKGMAIETGIGFVSWKTLKQALRKVLEYPLLVKVVKSTLVASLKSSCPVQILWNLSNCDLMRPAKGVFWMEAALMEQGMSVCVFEEDSNIQMQVSKEKRSLKCGGV